MIVSPSQMILPVSFAYNRTQIGNFLGGLISYAIGSGAYSSPVPGNDAINDPL